MSLNDSTYRNFQILNSYIYIYRERESQKSKRFWSFCVFSYKVVNSFCSLSASDANGSGTCYGLGEPDITISQQTSNLAYKRFQCCFSKHLGKECKKLLKKLSGGFIFWIVKNEGVLAETSSDWVWVNYWDFAFRFNLNMKLLLKFTLVYKLVCSLHVSAYMHKIPNLVRVREAWWHSWGHGTVQTSSLTPAGGNERERERAMRGCCTQGKGRCRFQESSVTSTRSWARNIFAYSTSSEPKNLILNVSPSLLIEKLCNCLQKVVQVLF